MLAALLLETSSSCSVKSRRQYLSPNRAIDNSTSSTAWISTPTKSVMSALNGEIRTEEICVDCADSSSSRRLFLEQEVI